MGFSGPPSLNWKTVLGTVWMLCGLGGPVLAEEIDFDRDIRPILSDKCFHCHGPDAKTRKAKLRLDTKEGLFTAIEGRKPFVSGDPSAGEAMRRILSKDPDVQMPPPELKRGLKTEQIKKLVAWVSQGAPWQQHWAFEKPIHPDPPKTKKAQWPRNDIDRFVLARLESEGLSPNAEANKRRLLRRVTLDLTGLPPTVAAIEKFLADPAPDAYEKVVDRLLASPRYGQRMAWDWLEVARYADSNGYQNDKERTMWPWRDWVVRSLNDNLPYDQFLTWQLAGDLLPNATGEQKLATGFCRNHMINGEGGRIPEENRVEYIFDQVETLGTTWLGLTMTCARCHDHKYDPISHKNYYQLFAYFNKTSVNGGGGNPKTPPVLSVPPPDKQQRVADLQKQADEVAKKMVARRAVLLPRQAAWEKRHLKTENSAGHVWVALAATSIQSAQRQTFTALPDGSTLVGGPNPANDTYTLVAPLPAGRLTGIRLDALRHASMTKGGIARSDSGNYVLTEFEVALETDAGSKKIKLTHPEATFAQGGFKIADTLDGNRSSGWAVWEGKSVGRDHAAVFRFAAPIQSKRGARLRVTLRHDSKHKHHNIGRFRLAVTTMAKPNLKTKMDGLAQTLRVPVAKRTKVQTEQVTRAFLATDEIHRSLAKQLDQIRTEQKKVSKAGGVVVMVMADTTNRDTFVLNKGLYNQRLDKVTVGVPEVLSPLPKDAPANRLALARWLTDPAHPLTARVTINRHWQKFFGTGLVKTTEDFGSQGEKPSHPKLLDWLATEFVQRKWDVKAMHRLIVTSATYRQSAKTTPERIARDPENRLLSRGPRYRLTSWMLRDQALFAGGLLVDRMGGPPVKPYQPQGVWAEATFGKKRYKIDTGEGLYRRSLYVFWRRIVGPTMFFDVAKRQTCEVKVARTNTPLHALLTLNDTTYVEAARAMAQRLLQTGGATDAQKIERAFLITLARKPSADETKILSGRLATLRQQYTADRASAEALMKVGVSPRDPKLDVVEHAAYTGLCSLIMNLDEWLSK